MVNVPTSLVNLKTEVDDLDVSKLKRVQTDLKKISDVVSKGFVKNITFNKRNIKLKTLQKTIPGAITLVHISQYNTDKQSL